MITGIIIQARKGSKRLPNKMVLPFFEEKGILELLIGKLLNKFSNTRIVLATTDSKLDNELETIANKYNISCYRGEENDVLNRFICTAEKFNFKYVIRICADNPFLDLAHIPDLIEQLESKNFDYISYKTENNIPTIKTHLGLFTEGVKLEALKRVSQNTRLELYIEHVTNYIYENPNLFNLKFIPIPHFLKGCDDIRLTLDTLSDFKMESRLFSELGDVDTETLINYINNQPRLIEKMKKEILNNSK